MFDIIRRLLVAGLALGVMAGNADEFTRFYDESVESARHLATAADLRSIGLMLDYQFMKTGRYPQGDDFMNWMRTNFKESPTDSLGHDHWGTLLSYTASEDRKRFMLSSAGSDHIPNTLDDLRITGP